jgi:hypothetical protein
MEGDGQELLTKDDLARCSRWRQVCWLKDDCLNGGPLGIVSTTSAALFFLDDQGGYGFFAREDRVRVFFLCLSLIFLVSLPLCEYVSPPSAYGWRFTYIENLYTCYLRKYYNNYCRDCLL